VYFNIDEDLDALEQAKSLNHGERRTPTIDVGLGGPALVEPDNDTLTAALVEIEMLTEFDVRERQTVQNVGDLERVLRTAAGATLVLAGVVAPRGVGGALKLVGAAVALSGIGGWCPVYQASGVTSIDGPGDRPTETPRARWVVPANSPREVAEAGR
jgi:hypothetical protein